MKTGIKLGVKSGIKAKKKTIVILASKPTHIDEFANINNLPSTLSSRAIFILVINKDLYSKALETHGSVFKNIIPISVDILEEGLIVGYDLDELNSILGKLVEQYQDPYFIVPDEFNVERVERVLAKYNLPIWSKNTAKICRDKVFMKDFMAQKNIRVPKYTKLDSNSIFGDLETSLGLPFIIKPIDFAGAIGVELVESQKQYDLIQKQLRTDLTYEAEEYIQGDLYHIDTVKHVSKSVCTISQYTSPLAESKDGKIVGSIILLETDPIFKKLSQFNNRVIKALNNEGCFHHEVFVTKNGEVVFLEIAWRQAGTPTTHSFSYAYGYTQTLTYIISLLTDVGSQNQISLKPLGEYTIEYWVPKVKGAYQGMNLPKLKGKVTIENSIPVGTEVTENAIGYFDISAKIRLTYPDFHNSYDHMLSDFTTLKK